MLLNEHSGRSRVLNLTLTTTLQAEIAHRAYSGLELATACTEILAVSSEGNVFINNEAPWTAFKSVSSRAPLLYCTRVPSGGRKEVSQQE